MSTGTLPPQARSSSKPIQVGDKAPDFTLLDQNNTPVQFYNLVKRGVVVLYFYPKDFTPGCTTEACAFRDNYEAFLEAGAAVVGVSMDSAATHEGFAQTLHLPFTLLADSSGAVQRLFGVPKTLGLFSGRVTYVIDQTGTVRHMFSSQINAAKHVKEALHAIEKIKGETA